MNTPEFSINDPDFLVWTSQFDPSVHRQFSSIDTHSAGSPSRELLRAHTASADFHATLGHLGVMYGIDQAYRIPRESGYTTEFITPPPVPVEEFSNVEVYRVSINNVENNHDNERTRRYELQDYFVSTQHPVLLPELHGERLMRYQGSNYEPRVSRLFNVVDGPYMRLAMFSEEVSSLVVTLLSLSEATISEPSQYIEED